MRRPSAGPDSPAAPETLLMTIDEAARMLRVSRRTMWSLIAAREIQRVLIKGSARIRRADLVRYIDRAARTRR